MRVDRDWVLIHHVRLTWWVWCGYKNDCYNCCGYNFGCYNCGCYNCVCVIPLYVITCLLMVDYIQKKQGNWGRGIGFTFYLPLQTHLLGYGPPVGGQVVFLSSLVKYIVCVCVCVGVQWDIFTHHFLLFLKKRARSSFNLPLYQKKKRGKGKGKGKKRGKKGKGCERINNKYWL